jgi:acylphosphatase
MTEIKRTVHLKITGYVQGVYFRGWTAEQARALRITGWVRNRRDGAVEALFHGAAEDVAALIALCGEGPPAAKVAAVEIIAESGEAPDGFRILPTL